MNKILDSMEWMILLPTRLKTKHVIALCFCVIAMSAFVAASYTNIYLASNHTIEQIIWHPARNRQAASLGAGYPDVVHYTPGGSGAEDGPRFTFAGYDDATVEAMDINFHCNHQVKDSGTAYIDIHGTMATANTGNVRMRVDVWRLTYVDTDDADLLSLMTSLGTADVTTSWTINPKDYAYGYDYNFVDIDDMNVIHGGEMGQFEVGDLVGGYQNDWLVKITRVADDVLDTHTGDLLVSRVELHIPVKAEQRSYGN